MSRARRTRRARGARGVWRFDRRRQVQLSRRGTDNRRSDDERPASRVEERGLARRLSPGHRNGDKAGGERRLGFDGAQVGGPHVLPGGQGGQDRAFERRGTGGSLSHGVRPGDEHGGDAAQVAELLLITWEERHWIDQGSGLARGVLDEVAVQVKPPGRVVLAPFVDLRRDFLHVTM
jgi:hypothetical protein